MKKTITIAVALMLSVTFFGQEKQKSDTIKVPVYFIDITDTVKGIVLYKKKEKSKRIYSVEGYNLFRGFKTLDGKWVTQPVHVGALDNKKRRLYYWISIK